MKHLLLARLTPLLIGAPPPPPPPPTTTTSRPNVVFILIDDFSYYDITAYGDSRVDRLVNGFFCYFEKKTHQWLILYVCEYNRWKLNEHGMISKFHHHDTDLSDPIIAVSSDRKQFPVRKKGPC